VWCYLFLHSWTEILDALFKHRGSQDWESLVPRALAWTEGNSARVERNNNPFYNNKLILVLSLLARVSHPPFEASTRWHSFQERNSTNATWIGCSEPSRCFMILGYSSSSCTCNDPEKGRDCISTGTVHWEDLNGSLLVGFNQFLVIKHWIAIAARSHTDMVAIQRIHCQTISIDGPCTRSLLACKEGRSLRNIRFSSSIASCHRLSSYSGVRAYVGGWVASQIELKSFPWECPVTMFISPK